MRNNLRKRIWIDRFQTYLSLRLAMYLILYQAAVWSVVVVEQSLRALEGALGGAVSLTFIAVVSAIFLGVVFIYDAMTFSHRIAGPIYRTRKTLQAVTAGDDVPLVQFRKGDLSLELQDDLNAMLKALEERGVITIKAAGAPKAAPQPVAV